MDFMRKNWIIVAVGLVVLLLVMRRRGASMGLAAGTTASSGINIPETGQPPSGADGLTHPDGSTVGALTATRSGKGHF
jgi:hypothetical protein